MDLHHTAHGRHRDRRNRRRRLALLGALVVLLAGALVVAFVWRPGGGSPDGAASEGTLRGAVAGNVTDAPRASQSVQTSEGQAVRSGASAPAPAASAPSPGAGSTVPVGKAPHHMAIAPDGRYGYVADPVAGAVLRLDTQSGAVTATIPIPQAPPEMVTFAPDGSRAYVSAYTEDFSADFIVTVDTATDAPIGAVPVGRGPYAAATSRDGRLLYVPYYDEHHLDVLDTATGATLARIPGAPCPHWVAVTSDDRAYTTNHFSDLVTVLDLRTNTVTTTIPVGDGPHSLELSPDGTRLAVVDYVAGDLQIIDTTTDTVVSTVAGVGAGPQDVTYAPDGRHLYTADVDDGTVAVVDTQSGAITARIQSGTSPTSIAVTPDGRRAFVTNFDDGTVRILDTAVG